MRRMARVLFRRMTQKKLMCGDRGETAMDRQIVLKQDILDVLSAGDGRTGENSISHRGSL